MKRVLSFLLSIVFLQSQTACLYAKHGGPDFGDSGDIDITGTYSGVLIPDDPVAAGTESLDGQTINSIGIFTLGLPLSGPGAGSFLIFTQGIQFTGTITAVGDNGSGEINGLIEGEYDFVDFLYTQSGDVQLDANGNGILQDYMANVNGIMQAKVKVSSDFSSGSSANVTSLSFIRLKGRAQLGIILVGFIANKVLNYTVDGAKQSNDISGASLNTNTGGTGNNNNNNNGNTGGGIIVITG